MFHASRKKQRVLIGLHEVAGYYANLRIGLKQLGCTVRMVNLARHPFDYAEPPCGWIGRLITWHFRRVLQVSGHAWPDWMAPWLRNFIGWAAVWLAALRYDVFLFSCGLSFADDKNGPGLQPLHRLGRKVVFIFNGSDSRATYCDRTGYHLDGDHINANKLLRLIREKHARLRRVHEMADLVIDYPLSGHHHTKRYIDFIRLGIPTVVPPPAELPPPPGSGVPARSIRILHCPSVTGIKGSAEVRRVIERLQHDGWQLDFLELRGVSNARVMEEIKRCDLVVDQLFSDSPMAGFAREAAQFARPAIVGGYVWDDLKPLLPADEWPPSVLCHPDGLEACLRDFLAQGPAHWAAAGLRAYEFIRSRWTSRACAERFLLALHDPDQSNLWVDPQTCRYVWGCGLHALETVELAQIIMRTTGSAGFCLDDKPELLALTVALGTIPLMESSPAAIPELPPMTDETWSVVRALVERNAALSKKYAELEVRATRAQALEDECARRRSGGASAEASIQDIWNEAQQKIENFRGMIERRDRRIQKLEKKLGLQKSPDNSAPDQTEE